MKKICKISMAGILPVLVFFFSCKNMPFGAGSEDSHLISLDSILNQFNAKREGKDRSAITDGKVKITVTDNMISIDEVPDQGEELINYFLQGATKNYDLKSDSLGRSEVLFLGRNLILHSFKKKKTFLFTVRDDTYPAYLKKLNDVQQYIGFGLGARKFAKNGLHENVPFCLCEPIGTPSGDCNLGGDGGAHGCGTGTPDGSCEVSCSLSAYACCDKKMQ